jgi:type II secretory pathway pseudopilin PulG
MKKRTLMRLRRRGIAAAGVSARARLIALVPSRELWLGLLLGLGLALAMAPGAQAQTQATEAQVSGPSSALASLLSAACRANQTDFSSYLTADSAAAFRVLSDDQRAEFMKRFSLSDTSGRPLISLDMQNHTVLRCEAPGLTIEFRFGATRLRENLAFIPVEVVDAQKTEFGMVREGGEWKLLSLGLVLIDVPQLTVQWAQQELEVRESAAVDAMRAIADAVETYRRAFGKMPDTLAQLGPAAKGEVSPDQASLLDDKLAAGEANGYNYRYRNASGTDPDNTSFEISATPANYGKAGRRSFFMDTAGKIHAADKQGAMATATDALLSDEKAQ